MSAFLDRLRKYKDDRGMMANLRCILVENKKHRAWPALNRLGVPITDDVSAFVAGLFATHPEGDSDSSKNFGVTCKQIERAHGEEASEADESRKKQLTPTERRFQHLLAANKDEIFDRVMRMVRMAKSQGVSVNYEQLEIDLKRLSGDFKYWSDRTKTEWATSFWTPGTAPATEEDV